LNIEIMADFHELPGKSGEEIAVQFLKGKGYSKYWKPTGERVSWKLILSPKKDNTLVVAEVKSRSTNYFGEPEEFVTRAKQRNLIKAANGYILQNDLDLETRFDVISDTQKGRSTQDTPY
jgi:putative endonuclease